MKILKNIDNAFNFIRIMMFTVIGLSGGFSTFVYYYSMQLINESREKVYILSQGEALELVRSRNLTDNITAEIKNHVSMFHDFFYNLDPDPKNIKNRINKALHLIDETGKQLHYKREENMYYHQLVEGSITSRVYIDSVQVKLINNTYYAKTYGRQKLIRSSKELEKALDSDCRIRTVARTENNPHGIIIENYNIINQKLIYEKSK